MTQDAEFFTCIQQVFHLYNASMNDDTLPTPPKLAAPGAGLPMIERFFARLMIRWKTSRTSREAATAMFATERAAILRLLDSINPVSLATPVLIKRLPGLEDSSRYWSLLMTVDHLRIVNRQIAEVIACLTSGKIPQRAASTAAVKPSETVDFPVITAFEEACRNFESVVAAQANLKTTLKFAHPWFGPMDAAGWHFMTGFHMGLHRKQMELILAGLGR
jgi:hypothetical protein